MTQLEQDEENGAEMVDSREGSLFSFAEAANRAVEDLSVRADFRALGAGEYQPQVVAPEGIIYQGDSIAWLKSLEADSVDLIFADPPYNIKKADWDNFASQEVYIAWSLEWITEASRVLKKTGSLYICGFSEILADLKHPASKYFAASRWLVWYYKNKANLGSDWGRSHESILHLRKSKRQKLAEIDYVRIPYGAHTLKYPGHPQAESSAYGKGQGKRDDWTPHPMGAKPKDVIEVPTTCNGMHEKTPHPTQKPEELVRKFVFASSHPGEVVLDPFSGSGTTAVTAAQLGRKFLACDLDPQYNQWAAKRLQVMPQRTPMEWFEYDRTNMQRRGGIR
ncbi:DNA-methyltransferase [Corynebacterium qintianiae]|nr:site-specific DNA-methyltransferase [Corynebacterium qintianiae]